MVSCGVILISSGERPGSHRITNHDYLHLRASQDIPRPQDSQDLRPHQRRSRNNHQAKHRDEWNLDQSQMNPPARRSPSGNISSHRITNHDHPKSLKSHMLLL